MKNDGIERLFVGWGRPTLGAAADALAQRWARAGRWDLAHIVIVSPGRQAGRRLRRLLDERAQAHGLRLSAPDIVTPADLPERLYTPPQPLASPGETLCAWLRAIRKLPHPDHEMLAPTASEAGGTPSGLRLARMTAAARSVLMAEGLSLTDAAERCARLPDFCGDPRWGVLVRLEAAYRDALTEAGLVDRDNARLDALRDGAVVCDRDIWFVGMVDLNATECALLRALRSPVTAVIAAPETLQDGFDDVGGLLPEFWHDRPLPIAEEQLCFPDDPTAEALSVAAGISAWAGGDPRRHVTVGVGDEQAADGLTRRLAARGLATRSPYGRPLDRTRPAALLAALRDFLADPAARRFAALIRHPDLESWLGAGEDTGALEVGPSLLAALDDFLTVRLPERMPATLPPVIDTAHQAVQALIAPLHGTRPLPDWSEALAQTLRTVYGDAGPEDDAEGRQLRRALQGVGDVLQDFQGVSPALAPRLSGRDALTFVLGSLAGARLPDDAHEDGIELRGRLELALDDAPALFLTGLHEGASPADALLPDTLRRHLGLPDARRRQARDAYLLRVILESRPHIRLFAARRGAGGEPRRPSRLLFLCDGETAARRALRFTDVEAHSEETASLFTSGEARRMPPPRPAPLPAPLGRLRVTAFRDYLACPYRFYLTHVLKLAGQDDAADEMTASRFGELLHACLAAFARGPLAESPDPGAVRAFLRAELGRQARRSFEAEISTALHLQVRQAQKRLDVFAEWQAAQTAQGWLIQHDLAERDLEAELLVDDVPFTLTGRLDRVDYHPGEDRYRILDYKTGDGGAGPDKKHRGPAGADGVRPWVDLQLPLYRLLAEANGIAPERLEVGYVLLPAELRDTGAAGVEWAEAEFRDACLCAAQIVRAVRRQVFWPPAAPARFPDALSPLCLDGSRDRQEWFGSPPAPVFPPAPPLPGAGRPDGLGGI